MFLITEVAVHTPESLGPISKHFSVPTFIISCQWHELWANVPRETIWLFGNVPNTGDPGMGRCWKR